MGDLQAILASPGDGPAVVVAAGTADILTAQADRILELDALEVRYVDRGVLQRDFRRHLVRMAEMLGNTGDEKEEAQPQPRTISE